MEKILELTDISIKTPNGRKLCSKINFHVESGDLLLIEGENGSGKTTLIKTILGLHKFFAGQMVRNLSVADIAYLPQLGNIQFFLPLTLLDVINLKAVGTEADIQGVGLLNVGFFQRSWNSASGGEKQKALLTRAFLSQAKLLVLDEPFNHIDKAARKIVIALISKARANGQAIILISHEHVHDEFSKAKHLVLTDGVSE